MSEEYSSQDDDDIQISNRPQAALSRFPIERETSETFEKLDKFRRSSRLSVPNRRSSNSSLDPEQKTPSPTPPTPIPELSAQGSKTPSIHTPSPSPSPPPRLPPSFFDGIGTEEFTSRIPSEETNLMIKTHLKFEPRAKRFYLVLDMLDNQVQSNASVMVSSEILINTQDDVSVDLFMKNSEKKLVRIGKLESKWERKLFNMKIASRKNSIEIEFKNPKKLKEPKALSVVIFDISPADIFPKPDIDSDESVRVAQERKINLKTKALRYDEKTKKYVLEENKRAKMPSINNIQIVDASDQTVWTLGKLKENDYAMDFTYPFSVLTAFALGVACFLMDDDIQDQDSSFVGTVKNIFK